MPKRYLLILIIVTVVFFAGVFLLIRLIGGIGNNGSTDTSNSSETSKNTTITKDTKTINKLSSDGQRVSYTIYGKVVGNEERRAIRITVDQTERRLDILRGYDEAIVNSQAYPNNSEAFTAFLMALEPVGFGSYDKDVKTDDRKACPLGTRYVFETLYKDNSTTRAWATSCSTREGSFIGKRSTVDQLFKAQIPDYDKLTSDVRLN